MNRVWQQHFGTALAATPNDLGGNGAPPTHPEILDHLAAGLIADGWSVKALHKRIVMSATWRQSSQPDAGAYARDPDTKLLWRCPPRRLPAEVIRDASGKRVTRSTKQTGEKAARRVAEKWEAAALKALKEKAGAKGGFAKVKGSK